MNEQISFSFVAVYFSGGLALFLFGIRLLSRGLQKASGERVRALISRIADRPLPGLLSGALATMVVQSSSTIIATLIGLVQSRLMTFSQSLAVILGAEIGTTAMAQLIAFRLHDYALVIFTAGFLLHTVPKREPLRVAGEAISGFGLLFFGLGLMSQAVAPLQHFAPFLALLSWLRNPLAGIMAGLLLTALMQSSGAFIGIVITLASQGSIELEAAIPLLLGANMGTCITAVLAGTGMLRPARRVALAQVLFNVAGIAIFVLFIPQFSSLVRLVTASGDLSRQVANAHSIYNVFMALLFLPALPLFERLLYRLYPDDPMEIRQQPSVWYLEESALSTPAVALSYARSEIVRMARIASRMVCAAMKPFAGEGGGRDEVFPNLSVVGGMRMREEKMDFLEKQVSVYLVKLSRSALTEAQSKEVFLLMEVVKQLESLGDVIEGLSRKLLRREEGPASALSAVGREELLRLHAFVCSESRRLADILQTLDGREAADLIGRDPEFRRLVRQAGASHLERVRSNPASERTHDLHMELVDVLEQVHHYCKAVCFALIAPSLRA
ncbi:Na/Pi cotransporter family protein [Chlorobium sp. N1]|nr:Na/Pi cotransporter family protein [Chlorobium sp. N1]TCD47523.1 Na/Pi cotransporter family protein [Chlorobium sp. N1]